VPDKFPQELNRLRKNSILVGFVTGHDFSRADKSQPGIPALAAAILILLKTNVAGAKAHFLFAVSAARLKSCPVTKRQKQCANRVFPQPVKPSADFSALTARLKSCPFKTVGP
jgi:hypothetical protein